MDRVDRVGDKAVGGIGELGGGVGAVGVNGVRGMMFLVVSLLYGKHWNVEQQLIANIIMNSTTMDIPDMLGRISSRKTIQIRSPTEYYRQME